MLGGRDVGARDGLGFASCARDGCCGALQLLGARAPFFRARRALLFRPARVRKKNEGKGGKKESTALIGDLSRPTISALILDSPSKPVAITQMKVCVFLWFFEAHAETR